MAILCSLAGGCVIPPPLEIEGTDAGINAPPIILSASPPDLAFPGPIIIERDDTRLVRLEVSDNDVGDTIYVRFFRDYTEEMATPPYGSGTIEPSGALVRLREFAVGTWCVGVEPTDTATHALEAMVADREFLMSGDPPFRAIPAGTGFSFRTWLMTCEPETP